VVEALNAGRVKVLVATGALLGEGFDCRELSTLFLATPIKFNGRLLQYLGRVLRPAPRKDKARVYDYLDPGGVLQAAAKARASVYECQMEVE
jgi:superfamily II DNA or RNA helicase